MKNIFIAILLILICFNYPSSSDAFWGFSKKIGKTAIKSAVKLGKIEGALPEKKIAELAKMINVSGDIKKVGKILGDMKLSDDILEDTYVRIILHQKKITKTETETFFSNLRGVKGFRTTLRKVAGISDVKTAGHLNEIRIANNASKNGFEVISIGEIFQDGIKRITDIDILIKKNGKIFPIEAKAYSQNTMIPLDKFRADMDTLVSYKKQHGKNIIPIFSITHPPNNPVSKKLLEKEAERKGIQLIYGNPQEQIHLINQLSEIL